MIEVYLDIETIPDQREGAVEKARAKVKPPGNYKKPEAIEKYIEDHYQEQYAKTALQGHSGNICSIAWALGGGLIHCSLSYLDEKKCIQQFIDGLQEGIDNERASRDPGDRSIRWVGHNVQDFDLRFLAQRMMVHGIAFPYILPLNAKLGDWVFDTMKAWAGVYNRANYPKLDDLCDAFGIENDPDLEGMDGGQVWKTVQAGNWPKIEAYNKDDVRKVRAVYERMKGFVF